MALLSLAKITSNN